MANLLLNFVAVMLPSLLYHVLWRDKTVVNTPRKHQMLVLGSCLFSQVVCMSFPLNHLTAFPMGLEDIPLILGTLYGGYVVGGFLVSTILLYRFLTVPSMFLVFLLFHLFVLIAISFFVSKFHRCKRREKLVIVGFMASVSSLTGLLTVFYITKSFLTALLFSFIYFGLNLTTILITTLLIETIHDEHLLTERWLVTKQYQVVGELAGSIGHEIRNPLTVVKGFTELLIDKEPASEERHRYLQLILGEVNRSLHIAGEYMALSKPEVSKTQTLGVHDLIRTTVDVLHPYALLHNVTLQSETETVYMETDQAKLRQVLINLIKNGIEAMPSGGQIKVRLWKEGAKRVLISVDDEGIGMDQQELSRVGNPFYSTKAGGTGLGLTTCQRIIQAMNGEIHIQSVKGQGTIVTIRFFCDRTRKNLKSDACTPRTETSK